MHGVPGINWSYAPNKTSTVAEQMLDISCCTSCSNHPGASVSSRAYLDNTRILTCICPITKVHSILLTTPRTPKESKHESRMWVGLSLARPIPRRTWGLKVEEPRRNDAIQDERQFSLNPIKDISLRAFRLTLLCYVACIVVHTQHNGVT